MQRYALLLILCIAAYLRFYHLDASSLWSDEGNTWALLSRSFSQIATDAAADIHPPGYYWLLKIWTTFFGQSVYGMRSFSAVSGTLLVLVVHQIVAYRERNTITPLLTAFIIALNPFLIYYSQEARMYILLALETTTLLYILHHLILSSPHPFILSSPHPFIPSSCYILCAAAGLWTHYTFPMVLAVATIIYFWAWYGITCRKQTIDSKISYSGISPRHFITLNLLALVAYLPWLPTAIGRVLQWPTRGDPVNLIQAMQRVLETLTFGPLQPISPRYWVIGATVLSLVGIIMLWRNSSQLAMAITCWLLAPILLMFGLFSDAFLKFLIVAAPPWAIAIAYAADLLPNRKLWMRPTIQASIALGVVLLSAQLLPAYYKSTTARDNYASVAQYVQIMGDPNHDLVLLNAPGQQEVWQYYDPGLPILALPTTRPPDPARTVTQLEQQILGRHQIFALFWATDESDPERIVEHWLDRNAFKGLESWQGNLRFVTYALADQAALGCDVSDIAFLLDDVKIAQLEKICQPKRSQTLIPGEVALISLQWRTEESIKQRYKITLQLLNNHNQVIAQRDSEPAGGSRPTNGWQPQELIGDNHGLTIPPATPPGSYNLILALYDSETGQRLQVYMAESSQGDLLDFATLDTVEIGRPDRQMPITIMPMQHRVDRQLGPVRLVGYTAHAKGFDHAPQTAIQAGDQAQFTFYWQAPPKLTSEWPVDLTFTLQLGGQAITVPLVGAAYPTKMWQAGDLVRGSFDILFDGTDNIPVITIQEDRLHLQALP